MTPEEKRKEELINSILEKYERLQKIRAAKAKKKGGEVTL